MIVWLGGGGHFGEPRFDALLKSIGNRPLNYLYSYYWRQGKMLEMLESKKNVKIFLDSGAFSAYTLKVNINIEEYIKFVKLHEEYLEMYANLDVIRNPEATLKNQKIMEQAGLHPLPCFHMGEDFKYLNYYLDNYEYIGLGGAAQVRHRRQLADWMSRCFAYICTTEGVPRIRIHGFGITSLPILLKFPFYSVDSISWAFSAGQGRIFVPMRAWHSLMTVKVTEGGKGGLHFDALSPKGKEEVLQYIKFKGTTYKKVRAHYRYREQVNIQFFLDLEENFPPYPYPKFKTGRRTLGVL